VIDACLARHHPIEIQYTLQLYIIHEREELLATHRHHHYSPATSTWCKSSELFYVMRSSGLKAQTARTTRDVLAMTTQPMIAVPLHQTVIIMSAFGSMGLMKPRPPLRVSRNFPHFFQERCRFFSLASSLLPLCASLPQQTSYAQRADQAPHPGCSLFSLDSQA
jgi:hypothetical protein